MAAVLFRTNVEVCRIKVIEGWVQLQYTLTSIGEGTDA